jgi:hypothetical protein
MCRAVAGNAPAANIATASSGLDTAAQTGAVWLDQPERRANILNTTFATRDCLRPPLFRRASPRVSAGDSFTEEFGAIVRSR